VTSSSEEKAAWLARMRSIGVVSGNPRPREFRNDEGQRVKETTDEHGNLTRQVNTGDTERQDVEIRPQTVTMLTGGQ
jgi:hypothetical protein